MTARLTGPPLVVLQVTDAPALPDKPGRADFLLYDKNHPLFRAYQGKPVGAVVE